MAPYLRQPAGIVKGQTRQASVQFAHIAIADVNQQIAFEQRAREKGRVHFSRSKPDIGPVSSPSARQAKIRYAACIELLRKAVSSASAGLAVNQLLASPCGNSSGRRS